MGEYNSSTSPISGSISPDGGDARVSCAIGSAYAGGRMGGRERESRFERNSSSSVVSSSKVTSRNERRGRDRGTRGVGSGSGSSASPVSGTHVLEENRGRSGRNIVQGVLDRNTQELCTFSVEDGPLNGVPKMDMDASICSVPFESSTATIVPYRISSHLSSRLLDKSVHWIALPHKVIWRGSRSLTRNFRNRTGG